MKIKKFIDSVSLGKSAAAHGAQVIRDILQKYSSCHIIVATGTSQFETLKHLVQEPGIDWSKVTVFHLDEYVGLSETHMSSFRKYLRDRFISLLPSKPEFVPVDGNASDLHTEINQLNRRISACQIDLCFAGIGENGHLAFNDPPADFETEDPYIVVNLDEKCRRQQFDEGWFPRFEDVPTRAISMSIRQILKSTEIILSVSEKRKASAVKRAVEGTVNPRCPASIIQNHSACTLYLDHSAASELIF